MTGQFLAGLIGLAALAASAVWGLNVLRVRRLVQRNAALEKLVVDRTSLIEEQRDQLQRANAELRFAKELAEQSNRAKSDLMDNMSDEIRTPMNHVLDMTSLLLKTDLDAEQQEYVSTVRRSGNALLALIDDILDFSKLEAGRLELEHQPFDLRTCVEEGLDLVASNAYEKKLELIYWITEGVPRKLVGDSTRVRQVLLNLLSNAIKFTEKGEVVVTIDAQIVDAKPTVFDPHRIHVTVEDTGIGIPYDHLEGLFESITQLDASTPWQYRGTGLGLAIAKGLVGKMGGRIWVESNVGRGSKFHFTFLAEVASEAQASGTGANLIGKRVLIVDDNATSRRVLEQQIDSWGLKAESVGTGAEALSRIRSGESFDLAILAPAVLSDTFEETDKATPEPRLLDAVELAKDIRRYRDRSTLPLMLFTSLGRREIDVKGIEFGAVLSKPVKLSQLYRSLLQILGVPRPEKPPAVRRRTSEQLPGDTKPLVILLAEGNPVHQMVARRMLEQLGYRADLAANGLEVLESLERQRYDVILMDVRMPKMDGLEATRTIHRQFADQRPWIVAMTTAASARDREACEAAGMDDHVSKPLLIEKLREALLHSRPPKAEEPV